MQRLLSAALLASSLLAATPPPKATQAFRAFLRTFQAQLQPLSREAALAGFESSVSGQEADYRRSAGARA